MSLDIGYLKRPGNQRLLADQLPLLSNYSLTGQTMSNQPLTEYILSEREAASGRLSSPLATTYGRLVLEDEIVQKQNHMTVRRIPAHGAWLEPVVQAGMGGGDSHLTDFSAPAIV